MTDITRPFPHAVGPEKSVLSSLMQDPQQWMPIAIEENLDADSFYMPSHRLIFEEIADRYRANQEIELVSFVQGLLDSGKLERCGGPSTIYEIYNYAPHPGHFRQHLSGLRDKQILRSLISLGARVTEMAYDAPDEPLETLQEAGRLLSAIELTANGSAPIPTLKATIMECVSRFEERIKSEQSEMGIPTIPALDAAIRGLHPGRVYVPCAYPKGGKSVFASQVIVSAALEGTAALFLTMEMSELEIMNRMVIQAAGIPAMAFMEPKSYARINGDDGMTSGTMKRIKDAIPNLAKSPLRLRRPPNRNIGTIVAEVRRAHREIGIKVAAIDFAQLIKCPGKSGVEEVEIISHALQELAQDLQIAIILPSQLNADGDTKNGRVIEEDASLVFNIVQDRNKESETYNQHRHILIVADRFCGAGGKVIPLILDRERIRFVEGEDMTTNAKPKFRR